MVPIAFTYLPEYCSGNIKLVDLVVKFMDPFGVRLVLLNLKKVALILDKLQSLYQQLLLGTFSLFGTQEQTLEILGTKTKNQSVFTKK